jgi:peptide/nickel transport system permease protein
MLRYIIGRMLHVVPVLLTVSVLGFIMIELPPGDFLTSRIMELQAHGTPANEAEIAALRHRYGLDEPTVVRYLRWINGLLPFGFKQADDGHTVWFGFKGETIDGDGETPKRRIVWVGSQAAGLSPWFKPVDMGMSFEYNQPVSTLVGERLALTVAVSICTILLTWVIAIPVGIYSATRPYTLLDYVWTTLGFIGLAVPSFLLALILMFLAYTFWGEPPTGLFSAEFAVAPWSFAKLLDMLGHIWIPALIIGAAGTAGMIRVMRGCLLDELRKPYVVTARAKGLSELKLILKYPVRLAINPLISTIGWVLPAIISGETIVAIVLDMPTCGPMLLRALRSQDMYLAGSFIMLLSVLTVIGTLVSDILLAWSDPRIRYEGRAQP